MSIDMARDTFDHGSDPKFVEYYARQSQSAEATEGFRRVRDRAIALLAESGLNGALDVADIGCGAGTQALLWAELGHRVAALDVNEPLIRIARARAAEKRLPIRFDVGTATALPYEDASADAVLLPELLEHVADWQSCLNEAVRVLRPGGLLYLSTSNKLCPKQQEFNLPVYSWYPASVKRWCVQKALSTRPEWANHARYPAVNWFTYGGLQKWLGRRGFRTLDRFDVLMKQRSLSRPKRWVVRCVQRVPSARFIGQVMTEGTIVWALKNDDREVPPRSPH